MENERYSTLSYTKLFLLMVIPIYGLCFTALLAFSKDMDYELRCLARGALIARIVFWVICVLLVALFVLFLLPLLNKSLGSLFNNENIMKLFM